MCFFIFHVAEQGYVFIKKKLHWNLFRISVASFIFQFSGMLLSHIFEWLIKSNPKKRLKVVTVAIITEIICAPIVSQSKVTDCSALTKTSTTQY